MQEAADTKAKLDTLRGVEISLKKITKESNQRQQEIEALYSEINLLKERINEKVLLSHINHHIAFLKEGMDV